MALSGKLKSQTIGWHFAEATFTTPVMDLLELSGYARLFSELHQKPALWQSCTQKWEEYLQPAYRAEILAWFKTVISYNRGLFMITPRSIIRTNWKMRFEAKLRDLPRIDSQKRPKTYRRSFVSIRHVDHPSILIKVFGGTDDQYSSPYDAGDVFTELYLDNLAHAYGIEFETQSQVKDAIERLERYENEEESDATQDIE